MASYGANAALRVLSDAYVENETLTVRLHSGAPGNSGADNRIAGAVAQVSSASWSRATIVNARAIGANIGNIAFGVLSQTETIIVRAYSIYGSDGTFKGWGDLSSPATVTPGSTFSLFMGTAGIGISR